MLRELTPEAQIEVLKFAKMQQQMAAVPSQPAQPEQAQATPVVTPKPAAVKEQQPAPAPATINVAPTSPSVQATKPPAPPRPAYLEEAETMKATTVEWFETSYDFGNIDAGDIVKHTYRFKNTGSEPLKLTRVKASCGCTTPSWTKEAIEPGEEGFIEVAFNTRGKMGPQRKTVVVTGNFEPLTMVLRFQGEIVKPAEDGN